MISSIYVHVPFCRLKCPYCDFYSVENLELSKVYLSHLLKEVEIRKPVLKKDFTVYFGGGTPSTMKPSFFSTVLSFFHGGSEITVEVNPEDAGLSYLKSLKSMGSNRVSLGIQTFNERLLKVLGRNHKKEQVLKAIENALSVFDNVSVDVIYGIPSQRLSDVEKDISELKTFDVKHVSVYGLTYYEGTAFNRWLISGKLKEVEEDIFRKMYYTIKDMLEDSGFVQYEVSNFSKSGFRCKHNISYWKLKNYIGFGPSAASFINGRYLRNVSDLNTYVNLIDSGLLPFEEDISFNDEEIKKLKLSMGLRLIEGVNLEELGVKSLFDRKLASGKLLLLEESGYISYDGTVLKVEREGLFILDFIERIIIDELFQ